VSSVSYVYVSMCLYVYMSMTMELVGVLGESSMEKGVCSWYQGRAVLV
jgi:hypothetical protein